MNGWTESVVRNVRYAVRVLVRAPGFTATVVLTLALGIGANSAVFSAIDAVLLKPLPFPDADRLVQLRQTLEAETNIAPPRLEDWRRMNSTFEALTGYYVEDVSDTTGDLPERVRRAIVTPGFLQVWSVAPTLGRGFTDAEHRFGGPSAVLISDRYWRTRLGAAPDVLDRTVRIGNRAHPIVGVMPASFRFPDRRVDLWWPHTVDAPWVQNTPESRQAQWFIGVGRLAAGVTLEQARADLALVQEQLGRQYPETDAEVGVHIVPLKETLVGGVRASLWLLFGAVSVLLLIACTNIAALLLARATEREQEIAVRYSLGAPRRAVAGQLLAEAAVLAFAGAAAGLLVAVGASRALRSLAAELPRLEAAAIDGRILLYTLASAVAVALLCGLFPALRGARTDASRQRADHAQGPHRHSVQWLLVGVQVALSVTLLVGAGLLARSIESLSRVDPGFDPARVLTFRVSGSWGETADRDRLVRRIEGTLDELRALPGIEAAATAWSLPGIPGGYQTEFALAEGRAATEPALVAEWNTVSADYFSLLRIPLLAGERCREPWDAGGAPQAMVNASFANRYFAGRPVAGLDLSWEAGTQSARIAGVVGDARERGMGRHPVPTVYVCNGVPSPFPWFLVRTSGAPEAAAGTVRLKLHELEPLRAVHDIAPLGARIHDAYAQDRVRTVLLSVFAATALALACVGLYGTLSYVVSLRRREVGVRMALGALARDIAAQFLFAALRVVGFACLAGLVLSLAFTRALSSMLYGVSPFDAVTLSGVVAIVAAVAALAALLPAARAARIDPMRALREE